MVNFGVDIGQMIGLSDFLGKHLDFSSNLNIQNLSLGIYEVPALTLHAIQNYLTFSGSISLKLNIGQLSLNNITMFGLDIGDFNINNLQFELITDLTIKMTLDVDEEGGEIDTTITFDSPQIKIPADLFTQLIAGLVSKFPPFNPPLNCPDCPGVDYSNNCAGLSFFPRQWCNIVRDARIVGEKVALTACEATVRQPCLGINDAAFEAYKFSKSGMLSLIFGEFPKVMNGLINNGISTSLIAEIINDIPAIRNLIRNIFMGDQNIKNAVRSKVDCKLSDWSSWSACSGTCVIYGGDGTGTQTRTAQVLVPAINGGSCIQTQTQPCTLNCPALGSPWGYVDDINNDNLF